MKKIIPLNNFSSLLYYPCYYVGVQNSILIVPSTAGYYSSNPKSGNASNHIDAFCTSLSQNLYFGKTFSVYYLVLSGQNPDNQDDKYSYETSVASTKEAIKYIRERRNLAGVIGMCTGGAIAVDSILESTLKSLLPLVLYNTAEWVGWATPSIQEKFKKKYPKVRLDCDALLNAPMPGDIISKYDTEILQILGGNSDYPLIGTEGRGGQEALRLRNKNIKQVLFETMSDVPIETSPEYQPMIELILNFFRGEKN